jgi:hypothetical protein
MEVNIHELADYMFVVGALLAIGLLWRVTRDIAFVRRMLTPPPAMPDEAAQAVAKFLKERRCDLCTFAKRRDPSSRGKRRFYCVKHGRTVDGIPCREFEKKA